MALNTTASGGLSDEMKTFYDRQLLIRTVPKLLHTKFAQKRTIPRRGGKTIEFRKFDGLAVATTPLTEGDPPTLKDLTVTATTATIAQYGDAVGFSDLVSTTTIDPILTETVEILAEQAAETIDEVVREVLVAGTTVQYAGGAANRAAITASDTFTVEELRLAVLQLNINRARKINGRYVAIVHPRTLHDLQGTTEWVNANQYAGSKRIFDGSVGMLYGVEFFESDKAKVWEDAGATSTVDVYATIILGADAFGIVDLAGHNLKTYHKALGSAGTADPIDQQQSMGWKVAFATKRLHEAFMIRVEHATSTADNA
jgi:N4-gp56 family major capsid protein